jgi:hypothetical protein
MKMLKDWKEKTFENSFVPYILIGVTIMGQVTYPDGFDRENIKNEDYPVVMGDTVLGYSTKRDDNDGWDFHVSVAVCADGIWIDGLDDAVKEIKNELTMFKGGRF